MVQSIITSRRQCEQGRALLEALSAGEITPGQAATIMQAISAQARIVEVDELEKRVATLEGKPNEMGRRSGAIGFCGS